MKKKSSAVQRAESENQEAMAAKRKMDGLESYQKNYAERGGDFVIDTSRFTPEQQEEIQVEIGSGSITPRTFKSRKFFGADEPRAAEEKGEEKRSSVDVESRTEAESEEIRSTLRSKVLDTIGQVRSKIDSLLKQKTDFLGYEQESIERFKELSQGVIPRGEFAQTDQGLKVLGKRFQEKTMSLQSYLAELESFQGFIDAHRALVLTYKDAYENSAGNSVIRFGINVAAMDASQSQELAAMYTPFTEKEGSVKSKSSSKKSKQGDKDQVKMLHPLEVLILQDAIDHLLGTKTVLVDIFARNDDNSIRQENGKLETHTVVLYKNANEIIVIDPSDHVFSRHLVSSNMRLLREGDDSIDIVSPLKEKIYVPVKDNTGPGADQFRDCVDVAVKLAFGLNKLKGDIDTKNIESLGVVKEVTNNVEIMISYFFAPQECPIKMKQASDDEVRIQTNKLLVAASCQMDIAAKYFGKDSFQKLKVTNQLREVFSTTSASEEYDSGLQILFGVYQDVSLFINHSVVQDMAIPVVGSTKDIGGSYDE